MATEEHKSHAKYYEEDKSGYRIRKTSSFDVLRITSSGEVYHNNFYLFSRDKVTTGDVAKIVYFSGGEKKEESLEGKVVNSLPIKEIRASPVVVLYLTNGNIIAARKLSNGKTAVTVVKDEKQIEDFLNLSDDFLKFMVSDNVYISYETLAVNVDFENKKVTYIHDGKTVLEAELTDEDMRAIKNRGDKLLIYANDKLTKLTEEAKRLVARKVDGEKEYCEIHFSYSINGQLIKDPGSTVYDKDGNKVSTKPISYPIYSLPIEIAFQHLEEKDVEDEIHVMLISHSWFNSPNKNYEVPLNREVKDMLNRVIDTLENGGDIYSSARSENTEVRDGMVVFTVNPIFGQKKEIPEQKEVVSEVKEGETLYFLPGVEKALGELKQKVGDDKAKKVLLNYLKTVKESWEKNYHAEHFFFSLEIFEINGKVYLGGHVHYKLIDEELPDVTDANRLYVLIDESGNKHYFLLEGVESVVKRSVDWEKVEKGIAYALQHGLESYRFSLPDGRTVTVKQFGHLPETRSEIERIKSPSSRTLLASM